MKSADIINKWEKREQRIKRRVLLLTIIPIFASVMFLSFTAYKVNTLLGKNQALELQNDSIMAISVESTIALGKLSNVMWEAKKIIDIMPSAERDYFEATYFKEFRMMEERIRGNYEYLSETLSDLPDITDKNDWIVIVESSVSLESLLESKKILEESYAKEQIAIYKTKNYYALSIKGDGTFTTALRLNKELMKMDINDSNAYFRGHLDWGKNYVKLLDTE